MPEFDQIQPQSNIHEAHLQPVRVTTQGKFAKEDATQTSNALELHEPAELRQKRRSKAQQLETFANSLLVAATFAGTVTLTVVLAPRGVDPVPGIPELAYASSIFLGSIMGCIFLVASIELDVSLGVIK